MLVAQNMDYLKGPFCAKSTRPLLIERYAKNSQHLRFHRNGGRQ
jgi:hypothetical protein